jgi:preprotein translocase subunit YajC
MITLLMFGGMFLFMYLLIIRPQRKRQKEHQNLVTALAKGDEVLMTSGMLGKVVKVDDNYIVRPRRSELRLPSPSACDRASSPPRTGGWAKSR